MGVYDDMRDERRRCILQAAKKLICQRGIAGTQMLDIAQEAQISRQTLYKYFDNIDVIAYAAQKEIFSRMRSNLSISTFSGESALAEVVARLRVFFNYAQTHSDEFLFISLFDAHYNSRQPIAALDCDYRGYIVNLADMFSFQKLIEQGIADKSMRSDIRPYAAAITLLNMAIAIAQRLSLLGRNGMGIPDVDKNEVIDETVIAVEKYLVN